MVADPVDVCSVEVVYALPEQQVMLRVDLAAGSTVADAIAASGIRERFPGLEPDPAAVGIFGRKVSMDQEVRSGDRVEIYRPLLADPKESRRQRASRSAPPGSRAK